jgi:hypothetical protein
LRPRRREIPAKETVAECAYGNRRDCPINARRRRRLDLLVDPSTNLSTKYTFLYPGLHLIPRTSLTCLDGIPIPIEGTVGDSILLFLADSWMPAKGLSVSPKSAIRSRPFKLSQGDCRPPCRRYPNVAVSSAVGRPRRWSAQKEMRRHNRRVHSPDLCCRFSQFFILAVEPFPFAPPPA